MIKKKGERFEWPDFRLPLVQVRVVRPGRVDRFGSLWVALESIRPFVGFSEAVRIFEKTFGI